MKEEYGVDINAVNQIGAWGDNTYAMLLTTEAAAKMKSSGLAKQVELIQDTKGDNHYSGILFPYDTIHKWTLDEYGPIWIPKKGAAIELTPENYPIYERAIRVYEHNQLEKKGGCLLH